MDIHITKKIAGLMIFSALVGTVVGGAIGVMASHEEHGDRGEQRGEMEQGYFDNQSDGEANDDQGGIPNQEQQQAPSATQATPVTSATPTPVPAQ